MSKRVVIFSLVALTGALLSAGWAFGGPPFLTDDPEPVEYGHWENYLFTSGVKSAAGYLNYGPAIEMNHGPFPDTQLSLTIPISSAGGGGAHPATGLGDILIGVKYRFVQETNGWPQIAFYPQMTVPTGDARQGLGNGRATYQLPVWLQKSWGPWTTYGGAGPLLNPTAGQRDNAFGGWLLQRDIGEHLSLGGEVYAQGRQADNNGAYVALNFGGSYKFNENFSLLGSAGHTVAGDEHIFWYFAFGLDF